jgi:hypothetical protein
MRVIIRTESSSEEIQTVARLRAFLERFAQRKAELARERREACGRIGAFLDRFRAALPGLRTEPSREQSEACGRIGAFLGRFRQELKSGLRAKQKEWERTEAPRFNLFRVLRIERRENKLHNRFLAHLLNPAGDHGQGSTFLKGFLELLANRNREPLDVLSLIETSGWEISTEVVIEDGRLDILIRSPQHQFIAVVENKVDAPEGDVQLDRYANWLRTDARATQFSCHRLVLLTLDGRPPTTLSKPGIENCICLSHREDIADWLDRTLRTGPAATAIHPAKLRLALQDYLAVLGSL